MRWCLLQLWSSCEDCLPFWFRVLFITYTSIHSERCGINLYIKLWFTEGIVILISDIIKVFRSFWKVHSRSSLFHIEFILITTSMTILDALSSIALSPELNGALVIRGKWFLSFGGTLQNHHSLSIFHLNIEHPGVKLSLEDISKEYFF